MQELAWYRIAHPVATADEVRAHLFRVFGAMENNRPLTRQDIMRIEKSLLNLTRKRGSTTAADAILPRNLRKRLVYWLQPLPFGIQGVRRSQLIDVDECALFVQTAKRNYGNGYWVPG